MLAFCTNLGIMGALAWFLWFTTKQNNKREVARETRDCKREEKILNIMDTSIKDMQETVKRDSENTEKVEKVMTRLDNTINNHLVHSIEGLTKEIKKMNQK